MNLSRHLLLSFIISVTLFYTAGAQQIDTAWLDKQGRKTEVLSERNKCIITKSNASKTAFVISSYNLKGKLIAVGNFKSLAPVVQHGDFIQYDDSGRVEEKTTFRDGEIVEILKFKDGKQITHIVNKDNPPGNPITDPAATYTTFGKPIEIGVAERTVQYADGEKAMNAFISKHISYPKEALKGKITGSVIVALNIDASGNVKSIGLRKKADELLNNEALRVARLLPAKWVPARDKNGKPTDGEAFIPFNFAL